MNSTGMRIIGGIVLSLVLSSCSGPEPPELPDAEAIRGQISIVPQPNSVNILPGEFQLREGVKIVTLGDTGNAVEILSGILWDAGGLKPELTSEPVENSIILSAAAPEHGFGEEGYSLRIEPETIKIVGSRRGIFYGIQSLAQILPTKFDKRASLPAVEIVDSPRFPYRGMHLDVARHYFPPEFVKRYIDLMAALAPYGRPGVAN
jgi:hexosaminidase